MDTILAGKDVFAQAETGSGKTGAFVIPLVEIFLRTLKEDMAAKTDMSYIVLSPTRELAQQTHKAFTELGKNTNIKSVCIIGGENIEKQKKSINAGVTVLVATPGRLCDLIKQKVVAVNNCKAIVFDEADRLFDMGFKKDIEFVLGLAPRERQLIMLSATSNQDVLRTAYKFYSNPEVLVLNADNLLVDHVKHKLAMISTDEKFPLLVSLLRNKEDAYAIVFCNTQNQTHFVAEWLIKMGLMAQPISGGLSQNRRTQLLKDFRSKKIKILVCTDVAARGLDIKEINLVVNYDLPQDATNYVHRIGRTGRAGAPGKAISFCAYEDCEYVDAIKELIESDIEQMHLSDEDFATDICAKPRIDRKTLRLISPSPQKTYIKKENSHLQKRTTKTEKTVYKNKAPERKKIFTGERKDNRNLELTGYNTHQFMPQLLNHFRIKDEALIGHKILSEGSKKFLIFGAKKTKYKFFLKPMYKKLLLPFLIPIVKKSYMKLFVDVSYKKPTLLINFKGADEKMLTNNDSELLKSFEHLITIFLLSRIYLDRDLKIVVQGGDQKFVRVDNYSKENKDFEKNLNLLAKTKRTLVIKNNKPITLKPLNPRERRIIHQFFQDDNEVKTISIGDGRFKKIQLSPKN